MTPTIGSLFTGYGGLDIAAAAALNAGVAWHVEYDKAPSQVLEHHHPHTPNYGDITTLDWDKTPPVDILTGGYPCQPFSAAGKRKGTEDDRHLWPHILRGIRELGPRLLILENVRGHLSLGFNVVLSDLASIGWSAEWAIVQASEVGATHRRARLFVLAYPSGERHGPWEDDRRLGRLGAEDEREAQQQRPREIAGDRACSASADSDSAAGAESDLRQEPGIETPLRHDPDGLGMGDGWIGWGQYDAAIRRWEQRLGRPAPRPTELGETGKPRVRPEFVEWMMGLPTGWVTDPAIGISRAQQLKMLGNGVVPQQAEHAIRGLLARMDTPC